jgi:hypothetical protein
MVNVTIVFAVHLHHEHGEHPGDGGHHQLELQGAPHPLHAKLDTGRLHQGKTICKILQHGSFNTVTC